MYIWGEEKNDHTPPRQSSRYIITALMPCVIANLLAPRLQRGKDMRGRQNGECIYRVCIYIYICVCVYVCVCMCVCVCVYGRWLIAIAIAIVLVCLGACVLVQEYSR